MYLGSICNSRRDYRIFLRRGLNSLAPSSPVGELTRVTTPATGFDPSLRIRRSLPPWPCDRVWPRHWAGHCPLLQDRYEPMATYMCACWVGFRDAVGLGCCHVKTDFDQPAIPNDPKSCPARLCVPGRLTRLAPGDLRRARAGFALHNSPRLVQARVLATATCLRLHFEALSARFAWSHVSETVMQP